MTSKRSPDELSDGQWPLPLVTKNGELAESVRAYARDTEEARGESVNFDNVIARMERRPRQIPAIGLGLAVGALATAAGFLLVVGHLRNIPSAPPIVAIQPSASPSAQPSAPSVATSPTAARVPRIAPASTVPSLRLTEQSSALPVGESEIVGQARATLSADGVASGSSTESATEIALQRGSIELHVLPRAPGQHLIVVAGYHRFTVVGTVFTVSRSQTRIELRVQEGAVAVSRGTRQLAVVRAGGRWNSEEAQTPSAVAPSATATTAEAVLVPSPPVVIQPPVQAAPIQAAPTPAPATVAPAREDCRQLVANRRAQEAVGCYQQQAMRNGLAGETAAYELARLWRDTLGQPDRAVAAFEAQRSRFPSGALRREADLSIIELLPRLGRHAEALVETQRFLAAYPGDERKGEIHLLRGNIYREVFRDLPHAQLDYALGAVAKGRAGDDSRFFHAVCLEALGKTEEARAAYQAYLRVRGGAHSADANDRLSKLAP